MAQAHSNKASAALVKLSPADVARLAGDAASALHKFKAITDAVAGSPVTAAMERLVPGLTHLVSDAEALARIGAFIGGALGPAVAAIPAAIGALEGLGKLEIKPMDAADPGWLERQKELMD